MISSTTSTLLNRLAKFGVDSLRKEFILQGHNATNYTINNIRAVVEEIKGGMAVNIYAPAYAIKLNRWQSPASLDINERAIRRWMALPTREIPQRAYSPITKAMLREGVPTEGAKNFSDAPDKRRTGWIDVPAKELIFPASNLLADQLLATVANEVVESLLMNFI
jgi:hypothetical protein